MSSAQVDQAVAQLTQQVAALSARLNMMERNQRSAYNVQNTSIDNGAMTVNDQTGSTQYQVGLQADGTYTVRSLSTTPPPVAPSQPTATAAPFGIIVTWDGLMADGSLPLSDFSYVQVHTSQTPNFTPSAATLQGHMGGAGLFGVGSLIAGQAYYAQLVVLNEAGLTGPPSFQAGAVPFAPGGVFVSVQATAPAGAVTGDLWYDTSNGNRLNQYSGSAWVPYQYGQGAIATGAITANEIAPGAGIIGTQLASSTITATQIGPNAVTAAKIAANTITSAQIAANTITAAQIAANTITSAQILANTITAGQILAGTITATQISANTITAAKIAAATITTSQIAAGTIAAANLAAGIVVAGIVDATTIMGASIVADGTSGEILVYSGSPASGNLIASISGAAGTDGSSNAYAQGMEIQQGGLTMDNQSSAPTAVAGASVLYSSPAGRIRYLASSGADAILERSTVNVAQFTVGNTTTPTAISGQLAYVSGESAQSSEFEVEIRGNGTGNTTTSNTLTFALYVDGASIGGAFTVGATMWSGASTANFRFTVNFILTITASGAGGTAAATSWGILTLSQNIQPGAGTASGGGISTGAAFDTTVGHTLEIRAFWGGTASGQALTTFRTKIGRRS